MFNLVMELIIARSKIFWIYVALFLTFFAGIYAEHSDLRIEFINGFDDWLYLLKENLFIVFVSGTVATLIGVMSGILMTRGWFVKYANAAGQFFNVMSAIPTLAVLAIIMTATGLGFKSAFIGLLIVTILPIVKNTTQGILEVPAYIIEAAKGQGMTPAQILFKVQLPNALYVISAGVRTGFALNVGTSPLITLIAADSLGEFIFTGIALNDFNALLIGAVSVAVMAIITDFILSKLQYFLIPRGVNPMR